MSNSCPLPEPSDDFKRNLQGYLECPELAYAADDPFWLRMNLAILLAYRNLSEMGCLETMFCDCIFDRVMLSWAAWLAGADGDSPCTESNLPAPSRRFESSLRICREAMLTKALATTSTSLRMIGALAYGYNNLRGVGLAQLMFELENEYDVCMVCWCLEAEQRDAKRTQYKENLSLN